MARQMPRLLPGRWPIKSVNVKKRDGPERVLRAYQLLAAPSVESNGRRLNGGREKHI
jgi:hypothetical protein